MYIYMSTYTHTHLLFWRQRPDGAGGRAAPLASPATVVGKYSASIIEIPFASPLTGMQGVCGTLNLCGIVSAYHISPPSRSISLPVSVKKTLLRKIIPLGR